MQFSCSLLHAHEPKATEKGERGAHLSSLLLFRLRNLLGSQNEEEGEEEEDALHFLCSFYRRGWMGEVGGT